MKIGKETVLSWGHEKVIKNWLGQREAKKNVSDHTLCMITDHGRSVLDHYEIVSCDQGTSSHWTERWWENVLIRT